ncbi:hypothetical protein RRG08_029877 [Elysia crispata]|uniref:Uncharacterized protein n=1 Tax=Elysia crispata TaxID=231223 RepID=A0AAE0YJP2_9GAST|nr:hypothetical protein RRG08_029877 [Elysia crispata]
MPVYPARDPKVALLIASLYGSEPRQTVTLPPTKSKQASEYLSPVLNGVSFSGRPVLPHTLATLKKCQALSTGTDEAERKANPWKDEPGLD